MLTTESMHKLKSLFNIKMQFKSLPLQTCFYRQIYLYYSSKKTAAARTVVQMPSFAPRAVCATL